MSEEEILEILRYRLSLNAITQSVYIGGMMSGDNGSLYRDQILIQLLLDNEIISEVEVN